MKVYLDKWQVKNLRDYFGENDKTQTEHWAFKVFDDALKNKQCIIDGGVSESLFTQEQFDYVMNVPEIYLRSHLLHQVRLRDNMEADRNAFEKMHNELLSKYNAR